MESKKASDTIVSNITPLIESAVIGLRISGDKAMNVFSLLKLGNKNFNNEHSENSFTIKPRYSYFASFNGSTVTDDVIVTYFKSPKSYTGEDVLEIYFHGNPLIVKYALADIYELGIRHANRGEFTFRAFMNGKISLDQAEGVQQIISAKSLAGISSAYERLHGSIKSEVEKLIVNIKGAMAILQAYIDFSDEGDVLAEFQIAQEKIDSVLISLKNLVKAYDRYKFINEGLNIVIGGQTNAGKSSIMNKLLNHERSIVSDIPGTTRDYIKESISIAGVTVNIYDTAGLRFGTAHSDINELKGIQMARKLLNNSDIVLFVVDMSLNESKENIEIINELKSQSKKVIVIGNKSDIACENNSDIDFDIELSAIKDDLNSLISLIEDIVVDMLPDEDGRVLPNVRHRDVFESIYNSLSNIVLSEDNLDIACSELDFAKLELEKITGKYYSEEILDIIFESFCIGK